MCSNTSSSGAGISGSLGDDGDYGSLVLKKPKRQRVPKRGPGVAELEKILREQENKNNADQDHNYYGPPSPPLTMLYANGNKNTLLGGGDEGCKGVHIGESAMAFPEQAFLPTLWSSCESSIYEEGPKMSAGYPFLTNFPSRSDQMHDSSFMLQKKHVQYPSSTKNLFPHSGSLSSPDSQSAGLCRHLEPPSSQTSHHSYPSLLPEEDKIITTKRPRTFSVDNTLAPFNRQVSVPFPHMQILDQSPSCAYESALSLKRNESISRDHLKSAGPLDLNTKKSITDYGTLNGNFLIFGCPATPLPLTQTSQQEFSKYHQIPFQESMEGYNRMSGQWGSVQEKPFYSFLQPEEKMGEAETTLSLNNERGGSRGEAMDLSLRL